MTPSPQQQAFYDWIATGTGSCVLEAVAGAGKTTTLVEGVARMKGYTFFGAYNKAIADEIASRCVKRPGLDISTMHSAGLRAWKRSAPGVKIESNKVRDIFRAAADKYPAYKPHESNVLKLVSLAKQAGLGALRAADKKNWAELADHFDVESEDPDLLFKLAGKTLQASVAKDYEVIDFDDMIYSPLLHGAKFPSYDWVLVDEAQDTNATRRAMSLAMLGKTGRLVAVGDRHQAIYGFTGADSDALDLIGEAVNAVRMPLTVTYRCPKAVVKHAQQWVSHIQAHESAPEGEVSHGELAKLSELAKPGDAVLCRFNAPLLRNVYAFIGKGIPAQVAGKEIGQGLKALVTRWKWRSLAQLETFLEAHLERETTKFRAKEQESKAVALEDKVECLRVIMGRVGRDATEASLCAEIDNLFTEQDGKKVVLFSSIHKSKGREWDKVLWIQGTGSGRKAWEQEQEINLCYVAATRAKRQLVIIQ